MLPPMLKLREAHRFLMTRTSPFHSACDSRTKGKLTLMTLPPPLPSAEYGAIER